MGKNLTISARLAVLEKLMENHLRHHMIIMTCILCPILVGVVLLVVKTLFK